MHIKNRIMLIYVLACITGAAMFLIPAPSGTNPVAFYSNSIASVLLMVPSLGAATLFLLGLNGFSRHLKVAYALVCSGLGVTGLYSIQVAITNVFFVSNTPLAQAGILVPLMASALLLYYGMRRFARLFGVNLIRSSSLTAQTAALGASVAVAYLPHLYRHEPGWSFDIYVGIVTFVSIEALFAAWLALLVTAHAGTAYRRPMRLLGIAFFLMMASTIILVVQGFTDPSGIEQIAGGIALLPQVVGVFVLVKAAALFQDLAKMKQQPGTHTDAGAVKGRVAIDAIIYAAGLISNPQNAEVESALDMLRAITALVKPDSPLPAAEERHLAQSYLEIERYLAAKEPVRRYPAKQLRAQLEQAFGDALAKSEFWRQVQTH